MVNCPVVTTFATPSAVDRAQAGYDPTLAGRIRAFAGSGRPVPIARSVNRSIMPACSGKAPNRMNRKMYEEDVGRDAVDALGAEHELAMTCSIGAVAAVRGAGQVLAERA